MISNCFEICCRNSGEIRCQSKMSTVKGSAESSKSAVSLTSVFRGSSLSPITARSRSDVDFAVHETREPKARTSQSGICLARIRLIVSRSCGATSIISLFQCLQKALCVRKEVLTYLENFLGLTYVVGVGGLVSCVVVFHPVVNIGNKPVLLGESE